MPVTELSQPAVSCGHSHPIMRDASAENGSAWKVSVWPDVTGEGLGWPRRADRACLEIGKDSQFADLILTRFDVAQTFVNTHRIP
jgi:hypothetical protein